MRHTLTVDEGKPVCSDVLPTKLVNGFNVRQRGYLEELSGRVRLFAVFGDCQWSNQVIRSVHTHKFTKHLGIVKG